MSSPVVRFAPSPTGSMHLGGLRTALFNYLFARRTGGQFFLRIEDTDQTRLVEGAEQEILETLQWAGLQADNLSSGQPVFRQSERRATYAAAVEQLVATKHAYPCFCSEDRVEAVRLASRRAGQVPMYDRHCRALPPAEAMARVRDGIPHVVRLRVPDLEGSTAVEDLIHGKVVFPNAGVDDQVLLKSDGLPTYHLANVVDDRTMAVSHVLRGEEWLASTPKHRMLYDAFGWKPPQFAHLPLLLSEDRHKLSKRHGAASVKALMGEGVLPLALTNFVASLGWNGGSSEAVGALDLSAVHDLSSLASRFSLRDVQKAPAVVRVDRLNALNAALLRSQALDGRNESWRDAAERSLLESLGTNTLRPANSAYADRPADYLQKAIALTAERAVRTVDFGSLADYLYRAPDSESARKAVLKASKRDLAAFYAEFSNRLAASAQLDPETAHALIHDAAAAANVAPRDALLPLRLALTGRSAGPLLPSIVSLLGPSESLHRISAVSSK